MNLRHLAAASVSLLAVAAPAAHAQEVTTRVPVVGPYVSGAIGFDAPTGADYPNDIAGGFAAQATAGWRVSPELALEATWYGAGISDRDGSGTLDTIGLDARIYPFLYYGPRGYFRPRVEPNFLVGFVPYTGQNTPTGDHLGGYGLDLGAGLRWRTRSPFFFTTDVRWMPLRYTSVNGDSLSPAFRGDDLAFLVGIGWQFPIFVVRP